MNKINIGGIFIELYDEEKSIYKVKIFDNYLFIPADALKKSLKRGINEYLDELVS